MKTLFDLDIFTRKAHIKKNKQHASQFVNMVQDIYQKPNAYAIMQGSLESMISELFLKLSRKKHPQQRAILKRLLIHLYQERCFTILNEKKHLDVLFKIAKYGNKMVRGLEGWKQDAFYPEQQLENLVQHCFESYPTASFLRAAFFKNNLQYTRWYLDLAAGKSVFTLNGLPEEITKRMAHEFTQIENANSIEHAFNKARVKSFQPSYQLEQLICNSWLIRSEHLQSKFWKDVIHFLSKQEQEITNYEYNELLDYLRFVQFENPDFTIKGRSLRALLNAANEWHQRGSFNRHIERNLSWNGSNIEDYFHKEETNTTTIIYKIEELCSSRALREEGFQMRHCVATYDFRCKNGESAIFSLQKCTAEHKIIGKLATIEVDPKAREIVQIRSKYNERPSENARILIDDWMQKASLSINKDAY